MEANLIQNIKPEFINKKKNPNKTLVSDQKEEKEKR